MKKKIKFCSHKSNNKQFSEFFVSSYQNSCNIQPSKTMKEIFVGNRVQYTHDGYRYSYDSSHGQYRCPQRQSSSYCNCYIIEYEDGTVQRFGNHTHRPDLNGILRNKMIQEMRRLARESHDTLKNIFDNVCRT